MSAPAGVFNATTWSCPTGRVTGPWAELRASLRGLIPATVAKKTPPAAGVDAADRESIAQTLAGDGEAYRQIVHRYQQPIADYLWRFTRDLGERDELVQDVFVEAYFSLGSYAGRAPMLHWLKRLATRVGYRHWKKQNNRREIPLPEEPDLAPATHDRDQAARHAAELVHMLLTRLGPRDRLVLTLAYLEGCSVKQTAELTGWSQTMVKVQSHRARRRLAKICDEMGVEL